MIQKIEIWIRRRLPEKSLYRWNHSVIILHLIKCHGEGGRVRTSEVPKPPVFTNQYATCVKSFTTIAYFFLIILLASSNDLRRLSVRFMLRSLAHFRFLFFSILCHINCGDLKVYVNASCSELQAITAYLFDKQAVSRVFKISPYPFFRIDKFGNSTRGSEVAKLTF